MIDLKMLEQKLENLSPTQSEYFLVFNFFIEGYLLYLLYYNLAILIDLKYVSM